MQLPAGAAFWQGDALPALVLDLSSGGARVLVPWPLDGGRSFALDAPRAVALLSLVDVGAVPGVVRWVKNDEAGLLVGFEFIDLTAAHMIGFMRHITDSPAWVRDDQEEGARVISAATRTVVGALRRVRPSLRAEPRLDTRGFAALTLAGRSTRVNIDDLSFSGCRIRMSGTVEIAVGDSVQIDLIDPPRGAPSTHPASVDASRPATVRWVERRGTSLLAGLHFEPATAPQRVHR